MAEAELRVRRRRLPHWTLDGSIYFVTFRLRTEALSRSERSLVRDHIVAGHMRYYELAAVVVMPDHVHVLLEPLAGFTLSKVMQGVKGATARRLNIARRTAGPIWQDESWDRIIRDADEFDEKLTYMLNNPVRAGLAADGWWCRPDLGQAEMPVPPKTSQPEPEPEQQRG